MVHLHPPLAVRRPLCRIATVGNKFTIALIAIGFVACIVLNPRQDRHRTAFMDYAHGNFFQLPKAYQRIYEALRDERESPSGVVRLRYGNFLLFSTLSYDLSFGVREGRQQRDRRLLSLGALGFVVPLTIEPSPVPLPEE